MWVRSDGSDVKTGYMYQFQIYASKDDDDGAGLAYRFVKQLTNSLKNTSTPVAFNNFFVSVKLLEELRANKIFAIGTVRANRACRAKVAAPFS